MKNCRITVVRCAQHRDLQQRYELPQQAPCNMREGMTFISVGGTLPAGLCPTAWLALQPYVLALASGATQLHGAWMKNPTTAMVSCNDGFRPVSFLIEAIDA